MPRADCPRPADDDTACTPSPVAAGALTSHTGRGGLGPANSQHTGFPSEKAKIRIFAMLCYALHCFVPPPPHLPHHLPRSRGLGGLGDWGGDGGWWSGGVGGGGGYGISGDPTSRELHHGHAAHVRDPTVRGWIKRCGNSTNSIIQFHQLFLEIPPTLQEIPPTVWEVSSTVLGNSTNATRNSTTLQEIPSALPEIPHHYRKLPYVTDNSINISQIPINITESLIKLEEIPPNFTGNSTTS